jgi:UDP-glucose 4-epimerase
MILVTGGAGYVGSHFLNRISSSDSATKYEVVVLDNLSEGHKESFAHCHGLHFVGADTGDRTALKSIFKTYPIEAVVHFAANAYVGESQHKPFKYFNNNVVNSIALFECMEEHAVRKIVFSSSCATYGAINYNPVDEKHPQKPVNTYGLTKLIIEQILHSLSQTSGWSYVALRYFNAAGADEQGLIGESHDPETHLIPRILQTAAGKLTAVDVHGDDYETADGTCVRDYVHVFDLADAHLAALGLVIDKNVSEAVNLGTAVGASVKEVIDKCRAITGREISVKMGPRRFGDPPILVANFEKAQKLLSWQPRRSLDDIIHSAWQWEQNRRY